MRIRRVRAVSTVAQVNGRGDGAIQCACGIRAALQPGGRSQRTVSHAGAIQTRPQTRRCAQLYGQERAGEYAAIQVRARTQQGKYHAGRLDSTPQLLRRHQVDAVGQAGAAGPARHARIHAPQPAQGGCGLDTVVGLGRQDDLRHKVVVAGNAAVERRAHTQHGRAHRVDADNAVHQHGADVDLVASVVGGLDAVLQQCGDEVPSAQRSRALGSAGQGEAVVQPAAQLTAAVQPVSHQHHTAHQQAAGVAGAVQAVVQCRALRQGSANGAGVAYGICCLQARAG